MSDLVPSQRLLGRTEDPRFRAGTAAVFRYLHAAADVEQAAFTLGFVAEDSESCAVGLGDDGERVRDNFWLFSTAWRRSAAGRRKIRSRWTPPVLWLLVVDRALLLAPPRRAWVLTDALLAKGIQ